MASFSFSPERPIFAIVIGIDAYEPAEDAHTPRQLSGCKTDALNFYNYLTDSLNVPDRNITLLLDTSATRRAILNTFQNHFIDNNIIQQDDAIVFYFAGHGGREIAPTNWPSEDGKVETICPYGVAKNHGIPDYTFAALLRRLAIVKGNNITAIFDSCHSGGMGRVDEHVRLYRPHNLPTLPADLDHEIWSGNRSATSTSPRGMYGAMESFVLLAACQPRQLAKETTHGGFFTTALVSTLKSWDSSAVPLTYMRLIEKIPQLDNQNPHCEGKNRVRCLFSSSDDGADDPTAFVVKSSDDGGRYYVEAGQIHGVREGTEFTTISSDECTPIVLVVETVEEFRSLVKQKEVPENLESILPRHSRANISKRNIKWLDVKLVPRDAFPGIVEEENSLFTIVNSGEQLELFRDEAALETVRVTRKDPLMSPRAYPASLPMKDVTAQYLKRAAHFHFFLYHQPESNPNPKSVLTVSLQHLERIGSFFDQVDRPTGDNLFRDCDGTSGEANLVAQDSVYYGLSLRNTTNQGLFPYVFYFDPYRYAINLLYHPHSQVTAPLKGEGSSVTIGYGAHGAHPFKFTLPPGIESDSGFIKIFVSSSYIDMHGVELLPGRLSVQMYKPLSDFKLLWGAWTYIVTVH